MTEEQAEIATDPKRPRRLWLKIPVYALGAFAAFEVLFLAWYWIVPDWSDMRDGKTPASAIIEDYQDRLEDDPKLPKLRWKPITKSVPKHVSKVFIFAEDSSFYDHDGFDYEAMMAAAQYNWEKGRFARGASTISQQTAKNMFLSLSKNPIRKWHEVLLTYMLEAKLSKSEILHTYLNVAEFGKGVYGIEAAAQFYFGRSASGLSTQQAVQLAASLPSPKKHNPKTATRSYQKRVRRISSAMRMVDQYLVQRGKKDQGATSALPTDAELAEKLREVMAEPIEKEEEDKPEEASGEALDAAEKAAESPAPAAESAPTPTEASPVPDMTNETPAETAPPPEEPAPAAPEPETPAP